MLFPKVKSLKCGQFLAQVERIIFSDWRIISRFVTGFLLPRYLFHCSFMTECEADVVKLECGAARRKEGQQHSQEKTISCLSFSIDKVQEDRMQEEHICR